jgi:hypothetical protein
VGGGTGRKRIGGGPRAELRRFALGFPGAHEAFPWGESVIKVRKKVQWVTESYRAVAPRTLVKELDARAEPGAKGRS